MSRRMARDKLDVALLVTPSRYIVCVSGGELVVPVYVTTMWCHVLMRGRYPNPVCSNVPPVLLLWLAHPDVQLVAVPVL